MTETEKVNENGSEEQGCILNALNNIHNSKTDWGKNICMTPAHLILKKKNILSYKCEQKSINSTA